MIAALSATSFWSICGGLAGLATVVAYLYKWIVIPVKKAFRDRQMAEAREAREQTLAIVEEKLAPILVELQTNGGGSLKDGVVGLTKDFGQFKTDSQDRWVALDDRLADAQRAEDDRWSSLDGRLSGVERNTNPETKT